MLQLSAAQPQEKPRASGAALDAGTAAAAAAAAAPPSRKALRTAPTRKSAAPKQTSKGGKSPDRTHKSAGPTGKQIRKGKKPVIKRERPRAKRPRKIPALRMTDPDWPWPVHLFMMRAPDWMIAKAYRESRLFNLTRREGITGPDEEYRARSGSGGSSMGTET